VEVSVIVGAAGEVVMLMVAVAILVDTVVLESVGGMTWQLTKSPARKAIKKCIIVLGKKRCIKAENLPILTSEMSITRSPKNSNSSLI
jgi:ABC-type uncharacterized transport system YnjBCD permease subunit